VVPISDMTLYNNCMAKSVFDKLFFIDKIDITSLVDYGCADGSLINTCKNIDSNIEYVGYDIDEKMVQLARDNVEGVKFTTSWDECTPQAFRGKDRSSTILLSSVIHEVYSYGTPKDISLFWERVFNTGFDHIVIRDLIPSTTMERPVNINDYHKILKSDKKHLLHEYESVWGKINDNKSLVHFLMKYKYEENFERECRENYFPITMETLLNIIPKEYNIVYSEHYTLPFVKNQIQEDFNIDVVDNTHMKIILSNK